MTKDELRLKIAACPKDNAGKRIFALHLKKEIVRCIKQSKLSRKKACQEIGISPITVQGWLKKPPSEEEKPGKFREITVVDGKSKSYSYIGDQKLILISPSGFQLSGPASEIVDIWRKIDASTFR